MLLAQQLSSATAGCAFFRLDIIFFLQALSKTTARKGIRWEPVFLFSVSIRDFQLVYENGAVREVQQD